jgi:hypothetical protein
VAVAGLEIRVDKNTTVVFPAPLMSTIEELGGFLAREKAAATAPQPPASPVPPPRECLPPRGSNSNRVPATRRD